MTKAELEVWIVRMGEKYPERRSPYSDKFSPNNPEQWQCIMYQIELESGDSSCWFSYPNNTDPAVVALVTKAIALNNNNTPWGQIPVLLGLVPGEQPAEPGEVKLATEHETGHLTPEETK